MYASMYINQGIEVCK